MIERGHQPLKDTLFKLGDDWIINLIIILFIDRITIYRLIKYTLFYIVYGQELILLIKLRFLT